MPLSSYMHLHRRSSRSSNPTDSFQSIPTSTESDTLTQTCSSYPCYEHDHPIELKFHEDHLYLSPECSHIYRMDTGENIFFLNAPKLGLSHTKTLYDAANRRPIFTMKLSHSHHQNIIYITDAENHEVAFVVKNPENDSHAYSETIQVWKGSKIRGTPDTLVEGDLKQKRFRVWNTNGNDLNLAAVVSKQKFSMDHMFSIRDTLMVTVEKDVNAALVVMLIAIVVEQWHKHH